MATNDWEDFDDDNEELDTPTNDSDLVKKLRKALRAQEKENKEFAEKLEGLTKAQRERVVSEVLNQKGVNPKAARLILKDLDDVNEESVNNWLDDNGDLFGFKQTQANPEQQADLAALRQQDIVTQGASTPDKQIDLAMRINDATEAELLDMINSGQF